jgi:hypothetical protein
MPKRAKVTESLSTKDACIAQLERDLAILIATYLAEGKQSLANVSDPVVHKASRALGESTKTLPMQHGDNLSAADAVRHAESTKTLPMQHGDNLSAADAVRHAESTKTLPMQHGDNLSAADAVRHAESTKTLPMQHGDNLSAADAVRHAARSRHISLSDFHIQPPADFKRYRCLSEQTLEFKTLTVSAPDYDWLDSIEEKAEPHARIYRNTPIPKRAPPHIWETAQDESLDSHRVGKKSVKPNRPTWKERVQQVSRYFQALQYTKSCV